MNKLRILMYHSIGDRRADDSYGLSVKKTLFNDQMKYLCDEGYLFCPVRLPALREKKSHGNSTTFAAVTFDDGYQDNLDAAEILESLSIPYSIYCIASLLDTPGYLTTQNVRDLAKSKLCTIGAHGYSHDKLGLMTDLRQAFELSESKKRLEDLIGLPCATMALPHGSLNSRTASLAGEAGYELIASSRPGINLVSQLDVLHLRRSEIRSHHSFEDFKGIWGGTDDWREIAYLSKSFFPWIFSAQWQRFK